jgi:hypothetical protein
MAHIVAMQSLRPRKIFGSLSFFAVLRGLGVLVLVAFVAACGTTKVDYVPRPIELAAAQQNIERLVMTQHQAFRPDDFVFTDDFFGWSFGTVSRGTFSGGVAYGMVVGSSSERVRQLSDRVYYSQVTEVRLYSWRRKGRQWWVVSLIGRDDTVLMHALRTLSREDAELMVDSLNQFLSAKNGHPPVVH